MSMESKINPLITFPDSDHESQSVSVVGPAEEAQLAEAETKAVLAYQELRTPEIDASIEAVLAKMDPADHEKAKKVLYSILRYSGADAVMRTIKEMGPQFEPRADIVLANFGAYAHNPQAMSLVPTIFNANVEKLNEAA